MTPQERALKVAMQWQACTDPMNLRVLALTGLVQLAIEAAVDQERERCAKTCEAIADSNQDSRYDGCLNAADVIRGKTVLCEICGGCGSHYDFNGRDGWPCSACRGTGRVAVSG